MERGNLYYKVTWTCSFIFSPSSYLQLLKSQKSISFLSSSLSSLGGKILFLVDDDERDEEEWTSSLLITVLLTVITFTFLHSSFSLFIRFFHSMFNALTIPIKWVPLSSDGINVNLPTLTTCSISLFLLFSGMMISWRLHRTTVSSVVVWTKGGEKLLEVGLFISISLSLFLP